MFVAYLDTNGITQVHRDGCADLAKMRNAQHAAPYPLQATDGDAIAVEIMGDFDMSAAEARDHVHFVGCTGIRN